MNTVSDEKRERLLELQPMTKAVMDLIHERRPNLYPDDDDATDIMDAVDSAWKPGMTAEEVYIEVEARLDGARIPIFGVELTLANQEKIDALMKDIEHVIREKPVGYVLAALAAVVNSILRTFKGDEFCVMLTRFACEVAAFNFRSWRYKDSPEDLARH